MSAVCALCGKGPAFGNRVARTGRAAQKRRVRRRTKRTFRPNLQRRKLTINGTPQHLLVCAACIKRGRLDT